MRASYIHYGKLYTLLNQGRTIVHSKIFPKLSATFAAISTILIGNDKTTYQGCYTLFVITAKKPFEILHNV